VSKATRGAVDPSAALQLLRDALVCVRFPLQTSGAEAAEDMRDAMVDQLDDYVLPRLARLDAPLLAVIGGSTGSGKSTLVNALVGHAVSTAGVLRPTTRLPVLVHHPADGTWFASDQLLPTLPRVTGAVGADDAVAVRLVASASVSKGVGLLDASDLDSVATANRQLAQQLLAAADLWLFVTSAFRYADAVPWQFLREAAERAAVVAVVLDRVEPDAIDEISVDLRRMLTLEGLGEVPVFTVAESPLDPAGMLPAESVEPIAEWLGVLAGDPATRSAVVRQTLAGAVTSLLRRASAVVAEAIEQLAVRDQLAAMTTAEYRSAIAQVSEASADGTAVRGEVLAHWRELVGAGEFGQTVEARIGRLRGRVVAAVTGRTDVEIDLAATVEAELVSLVVGSSSRAARRVVQAWQAIPAAQTVLGEPTHAELGRIPADLATRATAAVRTWQHSVVELVRTEVSNGRTRARALSFGVNGLGVVLMVAVLARSTDPADPESSIGDGVSAVARRVLESVFGDETVCELAQQAYANLIDRVSMLMYGERSRFDRALGRLQIPDDQVAVLTAAIAAAALVPESLPT
jgi:energy-coupling factor transporter ATP-binding protein EcfA2